MGSHAQDANTQKQASTGATAQDTQLAQNAKQNQDFANQTRQSLFGTYNPSTGGYSGGSVSGYLDPSKTNPTTLSGSNLAAYNNAANANAQGAKNAVGTTMQSLASRGMGKSPAGFAADEQRKAYQDAATSNGANFANELGAQKSDAENNYWNATNMLNSNASQTANLSVQGNQAAAGNYASLYGTASQQKQNPWAVAGQTIAGMGNSAAGVISANPNGIFGG
jgi:hypothetical protein